MPTHAELTATLLKDAATFFRNMADSNEALKGQMTENANIFDQMAKVMQEQPTAQAGEVPYAKLAGDMLTNAGKFFRSIAETNEPIREQMNRSADIYEQMARHVSDNPLGEMD